MKRYIYIVVLIIFCAFSWFYVIRDYKTGESEYLRFMKDAQVSYDKKIFDDAEEKYKKALLKKPNDKNALFGLAKTYFSLEKYEDAVASCKKILEKDPKNQEITIFEAKCLQSGGKYRESIDLLSKVEQSKQVMNMILDMKSKYSLMYFKVKFPKNWDVCSPPTLHLAVLAENENAVAYNSKGKRFAHGKSTYLGPVSDDGELFPAIDDGQWCFVDKDGKRRLVPDNEYEFLGPFCKGFAVVKKDGKFGYIDREFNEYSIDYENAYNFADGNAIVKDEGRIKIIDTEFNVIKETEYTAVVADEYGYTNHFGVSVFIKDGTAFLCNAIGENVTRFSADLIGLPAAKDLPVEFKQGDKYGFVDPNDGKVILEPKYEEAKAFSQGLAPIKQNGKWGFIDISGNQIVEPSFSFIGTVSEEGTAFVQNEAGYALLTFYYLSK